jgi:hypothetical protein
VAAGVLSTFLYRVKKALRDAGCNETRLDTILDELDLYRPTYAALTRILLETDTMRSQGTGEQAIQIIQDNLYDCIIEWLSWDFTYQASSSTRKALLKSSKKILQLMKLVGGGLEIKALKNLLKVFAFVSKHHQKTLRFSELRKFPAFLPEYRHYGFQIHGEGHTHVPLQEEANIPIIADKTAKTGGTDIVSKRPLTYINFGTWRDQIIPRKAQGEGKKGYRRRGVLRSMYILDLVNHNVDMQQTTRTFDYFVEDIVHWSDFKDSMGENHRVQPKT